MVNSCQMLKVGKRTKENQLQKSNPDPRKKTRVEPQVDETDLAEIFKLVEE
jgi:hypothetical protein